MNDDLWISCSGFTIRCIVEDGIIIDGAPIIRKFFGQKFENLNRWINYKFTDIKIESLHEKERHGKDTDVCNNSKRSGL